MTKNSNKESVTRGMLNGAVDAILLGIDKLFGGLRTEMNKRFDKVEADINFIKHDIRDIKTDLSLTLTRKEFNELKEKVETLSA